MGKTFLEYFLYCVTSKKQITVTLLNEYLSLDWLPKRLIDQCLSGNQIENMHIMFHLINLLCKMFQYFFPYPIDQTLLWTLKPQYNLAFIFSHVLLWPWLRLYHLVQRDWCAHRGTPSPHCLLGACMCVYTYAQAKTPPQPHFNVIFILALGLTSNTKLPLTLSLRSSMLFPELFPLYNSLHVPSYVYDIALCILRLSHIDI